MSELRLYVDEDAGENAVVHGLRARGVDILTTVEANRCGTTDQDQLAFAIQQGRSIYTFNVGDFALLHRKHLQQGIDHRGIIAVPDQRCSVGEKIRRIAGFLGRVTAEEMIVGVHDLKPKTGIPNRNRNPNRDPLSAGHSQTLS